MINKLLKNILFSIAILNYLFATSFAQSYGGNQIILLRDVEIENFLYELSDPIFKAAALDKNQIKIHLVGENEANAFVASGQNMFINTGLLTKADNTSQIIGVLAHETGHISAGHLIRSDEAIQSAQLAGLIPMAIGLTAAAFGVPALGFGAIAFGKTVTITDFFKYTRSQETAADLLALEYLEATDESAKGIIEFFYKLNEENSVLIREVDPYLITHPLPLKRISILENRAKNSQFYDKKLSAKQERKLNLIKAKIIGFMEKPHVTLRKYPYSDQSDEAYYARAISMMIMGNLDDAIMHIDHLLSKYPENPYFHELKGQIYFENSKPKQAIEPYKNAIKYGGGNSLFSQNLARAYIETSKSEYYEDIETLLKESIRYENDNVFSWILLAKNYDAMQKRELALYSIAEARFYAGQTHEALRFCSLAVDKLAEDSIQKTRCNDIIDVSKKILDEDPRQIPRRR